MATIDIPALLDREKRIDEDPAGELSLDALSGKAVETLKTVLRDADSDDVKRKAAVDILNFHQRGRAAHKPMVTEEQLEYLGRIIVETEEVRQRQLRGEGGSRVSEIPS